jgi:hypothetical protein
MKSNTWKMPHGLRRLRWQPQRQVATLAFVSIIAAIMFGGVYLAQVATIATTGRQLKELIAERYELERTNEQLRVEIAQYQTVYRLQARAQELGFVAAGATDMLFLMVAGYNPNRSETAAPIETAPQSLPLYDETFSGWLAQQWDQLQNQFTGFTQPTQE